MRCFFCAIKLEDNDKVQCVGIGKYVHERCVADYRRYLEEIVGIMTAQAKGRMN